MMEISSNFYHSESKAKSREISRLQSKLNAMKQATLAQLILGLAWIFLTYMRFMLMSCYSGDCHPKGLLTLQISLILFIAMA
jgi:hypothetical protein